MWSRIGRSFLPRAWHSALSAPPFNNRSSFLQALSACFGIDCGRDEERHARSMKLIPHLATNPKMLNEVLGLLTRYGAWTASGAHRFMPLALALVNMFRGKNIFDGEAVRELQAADPSFRYLSEKHPFYSRFSAIDLPFLILEPPLNTGAYKWLDIGSAPKTGGAPTLRSLKTAVEKCLKGISFEFYGTDVAMPIFELTPGGTIKHSQFYDQRTGWIKPGTVVSGITYLDAARPENNAMDDAFLGGESMDFISICMTLHHLKKKGEPFVRIPFTSLKVVDDSSGRVLRDELVLTTTTSHQRVVDRLLKRLKIGGILFLDPHATFPTKRFEWEDINENVYDLFFVLRRISEDEFIFYKDSPIPFRPDGDEFIFHKNRNFVNGYNGTTERDHHSGIKTLYPGRNIEFYEQISLLLDRADLLIFYHQRWKASIWASITRAVIAIKAKKTLAEIFRAYLENVPDENRLKKEILREAEKLEKT